MTLTWNDVLARDDLIGGDIESQEDGIAYRGPLIKIEEDRDAIRFTTSWMARLNPTTGTWENWHITSWFVSKNEITPQDIREGRVFFTLPFLGVCTIFPKGGSKLEESKVRDLPDPWERLLALYPDLPVDLNAIKQTCELRSFSFDMFATMPDNATMREALFRFRNGSSREEFLWFYIEIVTGEENVHKKMY